MVDVEQLGDPVDLRPLFAPERRELMALLDSLTLADWTASTVCPGWSVADIAAHMLGDDLGRLAAGRDGHLGAGPVDGESLPAFLDLRNEEWVAACRRLSPRQLVDQLGRAGEEVSEWWLSLDPERPSLSVSWAGVDPAPVWFDAARDLSEYWLHEQQIREAVGASLRNDRPTLRRMLDVLARGLPFALVDVSGAEGDVGILRTSGSLEHRWVLVYGNRLWWMIGDHATNATDSELPGADSAEWEVVVDADDLWRRWIRHPAAAELHVRTRGDDWVTRAVLDHVAIIRSDGRTRDAGP